MQQKIMDKHIYEGLGFPIILYKVPMIKVRGRWTPCINFNILQKRVLIALCHQEAPLTGNQVAFIRAYFELTGAEFGDKFGVTQAAVSKWEKKDNMSAKIEPATEFCIRLFILEQLVKKDAVIIIKQYLVNGNLKHFSKIQELQPTPPLVDFAACG